MSFVLVLPIALPGIVTALALFSAVQQASGPTGITLGLVAIILGHATFCVVVVFNNVVARLRRTPGSWVEASMDLGATVLDLPPGHVAGNLRTALVAAALLAFGLSFDEIVVTKYLAGTTLTLPQCIYNHIARPIGIGPSSTSCRWWCCWYR